MMINRGNRERRAVFLAYEEISNNPQTLWITRESINGSACRSKSCPDCLITEQSG